MKYTRNQLDLMQRYLVETLKMHNNTYPVEQKVLNLLLVMVADQRIELNDTGFD